MNLLFLVHVANPDDPSASDNFVLLGKTYEGLQKRLAESRGRSRDEDDLEDWEDEEDDEYGEAQVMTTTTLLIFGSIFFARPFGYTPLSSFLFLLIRNLSAFPLSP